LEWRGCLLTEERTLLVIRRVQLTPDGQDRVAHTGGFRLCDVSSFVIVNICNGDNKQKNRNRTGYARLAFSDFCPRHTVPDANELSTDVPIPVVMELGIAFWMCFLTRLVASGSRVSYKKLWIESRMENYRVSA